MQIKRSPRIRKINKAKIMQLYNVMTALFTPTDSLEMRVINTIQSYKILYKSFNLIQQYELDDVDFSRYLYTLFVQSAHIKGQLYKNITVKRTVLVQLYKIIKQNNTQTLRYYRAKINTLTKKVWLNDDVVYMIYSFI